eukprot:1157467-Pelagomonas_calceolata.AAC.8
MLRRHNVLVEAQNGAAPSGHLSSSCLGKPLTFTQPSSPEAVSMSTSAPSSSPPAGSAPSCTAPGCSASPPAAARPSIVSSPGAATGPLQP